MCGGAGPPYNGYIGIPKRGSYRIRSLDVIFMYAAAVRDRIRHEGSPVGEEPRPNWTSRGVRIPAPRRSPDTVSRSLHHDARAPGTARGIATDTVSNWNVDGDAVDTVALLVSELVTNAVEHAAPPLTLHLHREHVGNRIWIGVTDGGPAASEGSWVSSCDKDEHGRGIDIIEAMADASGVQVADGHVTHWARLAAW